MRIYTSKMRFLLVFGNKNLRLDAISPDFPAENLRIWRAQTRSHPKEDVFQTRRLGKSSQIFKKVHNFLKICSLTKIIVVTVMVSIGTSIV